MSDITIDVQSSEPDAYGYRQFTLGGFTFRRDEYFVHVTWPTGSHVLSVDDFLRALQRDCAWNFFYGTVNFDHVLGTVNRYGTVDLFAGRYNDAYRKAELDHTEDEPEVNANPGFEDEVAGFSLFAYLSRSDVTWNPSVVSVCKDSLYCPTTEEYILPIVHGNDRVEWFIQLSDEIRWDVQDRDSGAPRARVTMRAGDVAAMPADIRHQGYST